MTRSGNPSPQKTFETQPLLVLPLPFLVLKSVGSLSDLFGEDLLTIYDFLFVGES